MGTAPADGKGPVHATRLGALRRPCRGRTPPERHPRRPGARLLPRRRGRVLPGTINEVAFFVLPYMKGPAVLDRAAEMPKLQVVQTLTAGYEEFLPLVGGGDAVQRGRPARHQHGRTRPRPRPGQRAAPGRLRPQPDQRRLAVRVRPGPGRPAGPDHRVRAHRAGDRAPAERLRGRLGHPGGPARPDRAAGGAPDRGPAPAAAAGRRHVPHRPAHPADRGHDRRRELALLAGARCWSTWPAASWSTPMRWSPSWPPGGSARRWT